MTFMSSLPPRIRQCARLTGAFTLRSGKVSDTYFDKYQFEADPTLLRAIAQEMISLVPEGTEVLAGLEIGGMLFQVSGDSASPVALNGQYLLVEDPVRDAKALQAPDGDLKA